MAHTLVLPVATQQLSWPDLRKGLQECIKLATTNARVYSSWPLKYDIGKTVSLLTSKADGNRVHAWIISIARAVPYNNKAGGNNLEWDLTIRIWGFLGYAYGTHDDDTQSELEEEARRVSQTIFVNRAHLGLESTSALKEVGYLKFEDIDVHGFGESDVHVAQGELNITLSEFFM